MQLLGYGARYKAKTILGLIRRNLQIGKESTGGMGGGGGGGGGGHTEHTLRVLSKGQNKEDARKSLSVFISFFPHSAMVYSVQNRHFKVTPNTDAAAAILTRLATSLTEVACMPIQFN